MSKSFLTTRGGEGYAAYTVTETKSKKRCFISHSAIGWVVFGRDSDGDWYLDPIPTKREAVNAAQKCLA